MYWKSELKGATGIDISTLASKIDLAGLKTKVDNLDVDKLKTVPTDSSQLRNVVENWCCQKILYDKLFIKVNVIDIKMPSTSGLANKTQHDLENQGLKKKIEDVDKKIPNTSGLVKKFDYNTEITEIEKKMPSFTGLVTTAALNTKATEIENKTPNITNLAT